MPIPPGFVSVMLAPTRSSARQRVRARLLHQRVVGGEEARRTPAAPRLRSPAPSACASRPSSPRPPPARGSPGRRRTRCGLPSISAKWLAITGMSSAARAIAYAIRCVNDTLLPAAFSSRRRASSTRHRQRAEARRRGDRARLLHVAGERRGAALHRLRAGLGGVRRRWRPPCRRRSRRCRRRGRVSTSDLVIRPAGPLPDDAREVDALDRRRARGHRGDLRAIGCPVGARRRGCRRLGAAADVCGVVRARLRRARRRRSVDARCARSPGRR